MVTTGWPLSIRLGRPGWLMFAHVVCLALSHSLCPLDFPCKCRRAKEDSESQALNVDCRSQNLSSIPDFTLLNNASIYTIDLSWNRITTIEPDVFSGLSFVQGRYSPPKIHINENPLVNISDMAFRGITAAGGLEIQIEYNDIKNFPLKALLPLTNMSAFHFWNSDVTFIEDGSFRSFRRLTTLDLTGNKLHDVSENLFVGLENILENLYLRQMGLTEFPTAAVRRLRMLRYLVLDENLISTLPGHIFAGFRTITKSFSLSLQKNQMTNISDNAFAKSPVNMVDLDLTSNNLTDINFLFDPCSLSFEFPNRILAYDNPLSCDCSLYSVLETGFYTFDGRCAEPKRLSGSYVQAQRGEISVPFVTVANRSCMNVNSWDLACATYESSHSQKQYSMTALLIVSLITCISILHSPLWRH